MTLPVLDAPVSTPRKTIAKAYIRERHRRHSLMVNWFGFLGLLSAVGMLVGGVPVNFAEGGILLAMWFLTGIGITVGFHRHFSHRSFQAARPVRATLAILGSMAGQGTMVFWASLHRMHHQTSDRPGDPHSPYVFGDRELGGFRGFWHSYIGWTTNYEVPNPNYYTRDLLKDRMLFTINRLYALWFAIGLLVPTIVGYMIVGTWLGALWGFLLGGPVRMFLLHNLVWSITSIAHIIGRHELDSDDRSTNNFWLAIPTLGESWHNNHHAFPQSAYAGLKWWQIDPSAMVIRLLKGLRLAWDVKSPTRAMIEAKTL